MSLKTELKDQTLLSPSSRGMEYEKLLIEDRFDDDKSADDSNSHLKFRCTTGFLSFRAAKALLFCATPLVILLAIIGSVQLPYLLHKTHEMQWTPCGDNPIDARSNGCIFEPRLSAWIPAACHFPELQEKFEAEDAAEFNEDVYGRWNWFYDEALLNEITGAELDELRAGNYSEIWTTNDASHDVHCMYCWRKLSYALEKGWPLIDSRSIEFHHSAHCSQDIVQRLQGLYPKKFSAGSRWPMMYHDCVPLVRT